MRFAFAALALLALLNFAVAHNWNPPCGSYRHIDGYCNNPIHREWGTANSYMMRGAEGVWYADGVREPILTPNPRTVSNELFRGDDSLMAPEGFNLFWTFFGQFVTHDILGVHRRGDLNATEIPDSNNTDVWIRIPLEQDNDQFYILQPRILTPYMRVLKSRGDVVNGVFQVGSDSTSFLDLDVVYGKEQNVTNRLRSYNKGELAYRVYNNYTAIQGQTIIPPSQVGNWGEWLPLLEDVDPNRTVVPMSNQLVVITTANVTKRWFGAGDGRSGENYALNIIQGLFLREHNRIAREAAAANPTWTDNQLFEYARKINIAQYQAIVLYEFLPSVLGGDYHKVGPYTGYKVHVNPTASQLFAFAFRFGHTTVPNVYYLRNKCNARPFNSTRDGPRSGQAAQTFMPADQMAQVGTPENVLHAILFEGARKIDVQFPESLRSIRGANTDIIVQNQVRASENGIPDYNTIRKVWHGHPFPSVYQHPRCRATENSPSPDPIECFEIINSNSTVASTLRSLYGKVNKINFYTAVVAEEPRQAAIGQTSARISADQFRRLRDGDRWWFENTSNGLFTRREARAIKRDASMANLLRRNFPSSNVPDEAFYVPEADFFNGCSV